MKYFRSLLVGKKLTFVLTTKLLRCLFRQQHMFDVYFDDKIFLTFLRDVNVTHRDAEKGEGRRQQRVRIKELNAGVCPSVPVR
jgi:hypothetical protein